LVATIIPWWTFVQKLKVKTIRIEGIGEPLRLDVWLAKNMPWLSRSRLQGLINEGFVLLNDEKVKPNHKISSGELVSITIPPPERSTLQPEEGPLDLLYEDEHLLVINKPAGLAVHPGGGVRGGTLVNLLLHHCRELSGIGGVEKPGIVHRLDKDTTGVMVVAKDDWTHLGLSSQFQERKVKKEYLALVWGEMGRRAGVIELPIGRSRRDRKKMAVRELGGRAAVTSYKVLEDFGLCTYLAVRLGTGRTHQIRVHLSHLGHPLVGDPKYGGRRKMLGKLSPSQRDLAKRLLELLPRQALHAHLLGFVHPISRKYLEFSSPLGGDMAQALELLRRGGS